MLVQVTVRFKEKSPTANLSCDSFAVDILTSCKDKQTKNQNELVLL